MITECNHSNPVRILLADDHAGIRQELRRILSTYSSFEVVGEAGDGEEACLLADQLTPSVVVMDINLPRLNGILATRRIKQCHPHVAIVGLSVYANHDYVSEAMTTAGATVLLAKEDAVTRLPREILESVSRPSTPAH